MPVKSRAIRVNCIAAIAVRAPSKAPLFHWASKFTFIA